MLTPTTPHTLIDLTRPTDGNESTLHFAQHVDEGLSQSPKQLSSRYFYDACGSQLFQEIMALPEYYLTRAEHSLFETHRSAMSGAFAVHGHFHLVDLGAGDATKTKLLLHELVAQGASFNYVPLDISGTAMLELSQELKQNLPAIPVKAVVAEYLTGLRWLQEELPGRKAVLFLGSNIGNFEQDEALAFLRQIRLRLQPGDMLLLGVDLRKDPATILAAYNDAAGVTAAFNLNLLRRINRELGGNFELSQFTHHALYDPQEGVMKSYLVSRRNQEVYLEASGKRYTFAAWEAVHTESSHKYSLEQATAMGAQAGFGLVTTYQNEGSGFADMLFMAQSATV